MMTFAQKIRQTRQDLSLTQHDVAQRAGLTERYVNGIENGGECGIPAARSICAALGLGPPWPAVAFNERCAAKYAREFDLTYEEAVTELARDHARSLAEFNATGKGEGPARLLDRPAAA